MIQFVPSIYEITTSDGWKATRRFYAALGELFDDIEQLPTGPYCVYRAPSRDAEETHESAFWGEVENRGNGELTYSKNARQPV